MCVEKSLEKWQKACNVAMQLLSFPSNTSDDAARGFYATRKNYEYLVKLGHKVGKRAVSHWTVARGTALFPNRAENQLFSSCTYVKHVYPFELNGNHERPRDEPREYK